MYLRMLVFLTSFDLLATSCGPRVPTPACAAVPSHAVVFVGRTFDPPDKRVQKFQVELAVKGVTSEEVTIESRGICGAWLEAGVSYVIYAVTIGDGVVEAYVYEETSKALDHLKYFEAMRQNATVTEVFGTVGSRRHHYESDWQALAGIEVQLHGPDGVRNTVTGMDGTYRFGGIPAGDYKVVPNTSAWYQRDPYPGTGVVKVREGFCGVANFALDRSWPANIRGRLAFRNGAIPPPESRVHLEREVRLEGKDIFWRFEESAYTDDKGEYRFDHVAPGRYRVVAHDEEAPTADFPYLAAFWGQTDKEPFGIIQVAERELPNSYDVFFKNELRGEDIVIVVRDRANREVQDASVQVRVKRSKDNPDDSSVGSFEKRTDESGRVQFRFFDGFHYEVIACGEFPTCSEEVALHQRPRSEVVLRLNRSRDDQHGESRPLTVH